MSQCNSSNIDISIELCNNCDGAGIVTKKELYCWHNGVYTYTQDVCERCNGTGRVKKTTSIKIEVESYNFV